MYDNGDDTPEDAERTKIAHQIEKIAKQQHLTGQRRETFTDSVSLCSTCKWASRRRRSSQNTQQLDCSVFPGPCPEDIQECSEYATITSLSLAQMASIATLIDIAPPKRVGFHKG